MKIVAAALSDDVNHAARGCAILGGKGVCEYIHFLHGGAWNVIENSLASPEIAGVGAIHFEPRLAAAGAVGGEQVFVHEDVAHVDRRAIGRVEQRKVCDALAQQGSLFDLLLEESSPWEALEAEQQLLAIDILARLIANATLPHDEEKNDE